MEIDFKIIDYASNLWQKAVSLREDILRKPMGQTFSPEELKEEADHIQIIGMRGNDVIATAVLVPEENSIKMQRVVVSENLRNHKIGSRMMLFCEEVAIKKGKYNVYCHARDSAVNFYTNNWYQSEGDYFDEDGKPHLKMIKVIGFEENNLEIKRTKQLSTLDKQTIFKLWNAEYPENLNYPNILDFENYLNNLKDQSHILIIDKNKNILGWYFDFIRNAERWFAIIINSEYQKTGMGTKILGLAKQKEPILNGWVLDHYNDYKNNGEIYLSPLGFYIKNGFVKLEERCELKKISAVRVQWRR